MIISHTFTCDTQEILTKISPIFLSFHRGLAFDQVGGVYEGECVQSLIDESFREDFENSSPSL